MDADSRQYRAAVLAGRAQVLQEISRVMARLGNNMAGADQIDALDLASNWSELAAWLSQSTLEAAEEIQLLHAA